LGDNARKGGEKEKLGGRVRKKTVGKEGKAIALSTTESGPKKARKEVTEGTEGTGPKVMLRWLQSHTDERWKREGREGKVG